MSDWANARIVVPDVDIPNPDWTEKQKQAYRYAIAAVESGGIVCPIPPPETGDAS